MTSLTNAELREELAVARKRRDMLATFEAYLGEEGAPMEFLNWIGTRLLKAEEEAKRARIDCDLAARAW